MRPAVALVTATTMANAAAGLAAIAVLLLGDALAMPPERRVWWAGALLTLGLLPDVLDGILARSLNATSPLGAQLDVFADTVTFNLATAVAIIAAPILVSGATWSERPGSLVLSFAGGLCYMCFGLYRSSRLLVSEDPDAQRGRYFWGLTTNGASMTIATLLLLQARFAGVVPLDVRAFAPVAAALPLSVLMVSRIPYPDMPGHMLRGIIPHWLTATLLPIGWFAGPDVAWGTLVFAALAVPPLLHVAGRGPSLTPAQSLDPQ